MMPDYMLLTLAYLLDLIIGDPAYLPHPVRVMGVAVRKTESLLRALFRINKDVVRSIREKTAGILLVVIITGSVYLTMSIIERLFFASSGSGYTALQIIGALIFVYLTSATLATKELIISVNKIISPVKNGDISGAREMLSHIVGRDTDRLDENGVLRASVESIAENTSDGIIAPLFYFLLGGLPLAMTYKAVNTLDSMVGYRNEKYINFGWAAARLDDVANFIPARITGVLIAVGAAIAFRSLFRVRHSLKIMLRDGRKHLSPNSGMPEAAMAGALNITVGGPSTYRNILVDKPVIGDGLNSDYLNAAGHAVRIVRIASMLGFFIAAGVLYARAVQ